MALVLTRNGMLFFIKFISPRSFLLDPFRDEYLDYRAGQLEALGDLARYLISIAAMVPTAPQARPCLPTPSVGITGHDGGDQYSRLSRIPLATRSLVTRRCPRWAVVWSPQ